MGIQESDYKSPLHWRYFVSLETDLSGVARYIEFNQMNFETFSVELASILLATCSEVDVVAKLLCKKIKKNSKAKNIGHYANQIASARPRISNFKVEIPRYGLMLQPWVNWGGKSKRSPNWWRAHNNVKHNRDAFFHDANLSNTLNAVGGLYVLMLFLYQEYAEDGELGPNPILFRPTVEFFDGVTLVDTEMLINYNLGS